MNLDTPKKIDNQRSYQEAHGNSGRNAGNYRSGVTIGELFVIPVAGLK